MTPIKIWDSNRGMRLCLYSCHIDSTSGVSRNWSRLHNRLLRT